MITVNNHTAGDDCVEHFAGNFIKKGMCSTAQRVDRRKNISNKQITNWNRY